MNEDKRGVSAEPKGSRSFCEHVEMLVTAGRDRSCQATLSEII